MSCKFILVTGFLGSGKTSLVKQMLNQWGESAKIAVIQNEFAATGVDGKELTLASPGVKLVEINNGSVFCVCLLGHFVQTLETLLDEHNPDYIVLEASGLADPINVVEMLDADELKGRIELDRIITLVDAMHVEQSLAMLARSRHQVMIADTILLNKIDCVDKDLGTISDKLIALNPFVSIHPTRFAKISLEQLDSGTDTKKGSRQAAMRYVGAQPAARPKELSTCVVRTHQRFTESGLRSLLKVLQRQCLRVKGFVQTTTGSTLSFHTVFEQMQITTIDSYTGPAELIAFSAELTSKQVRTMMKEFSE